MIKYGVVFSFPWPGAAGLSQHRSLLSSLVKRRGSSGARSQWLLWPKSPLQMAQSPAHSSKPLVLLLPLWCYQPPSCCPTLPSRKRKCTALL